MCERVELQVDNGAFKVLGWSQRERLSKGKVGGGSGKKGGGA